MWRTRTMEHPAAFTEVGGLSLTTTWTHLDAAMLSEISSHRSMNAAGPHSGGDPKAAKLPATENPTAGAGGGRGGVGAQERAKFPSRGPEKFWKCAVQHGPQSTKQSRALQHVKKTDLMFLTERERGREEETKPQKTRILGG